MYIESLVLAFNLFLSNRQICSVTGMRYILLSKFKSAISAKKIKIYDCRQSKINTLWAQSWQGLSWHAIVPLSVSNSLNYLGSYGLRIFKFCWSMFPSKSEIYFSNSFFPRTRSDVKMRKELTSQLHVGKR